MLPVKLQLGDINDRFFAFDQAGDDLAGRGGVHKTVAGEAGGDDQAGEGGIEDRVLVGRLIA